MVNEHTGQLIADGTVDQHCHHGGIDAAAQGTQYFFVADFIADIFDSILNKGLHCPVAFAAAYFVQEVRDHLVPLHGMAHFWMELYCIEFLIVMAHCRNRRTLCTGIQLKASRKLNYMVAVAHPYGLAALKTCCKH
ncbi:hypothetical protein D3C73_1182160 [compost metagenome]